MAQAPNFDEMIDRVGTHSDKWDEMERIFGVSPKDGIPMWVADMDFRPPACAQDALVAMTRQGVYGYWGDNRDYLAAIQWWMKTRHGWQVDPDWIFTTHGLVNGTGVCVDAFTETGDGVMLMTPVYHAFARVIRAAGRRVVECPLVQEDGLYRMDFDAWDKIVSEDGGVKMLILCSPHNPGGRVWTRAELKATADFCARHGLTLICDEIHHDLIMPGNTHVAMATATDYPVVMLTSTTKTFNIAGAHTGNVIIADPTLRAKFAARMAALSLSPNSFGLTLATAAYSAEGAEWVDALTVYLDGNRRLFEAALDAIPGVRAMPLQATYLAWIDFAGTGMAAEEVVSRIQTRAKIAANHGASFGTGGETWMRFNFATPRARVAEAAERLAQAFADLQ